MNLKIAAFNLMPGSPKRVANEVIRRHGGVEADAPVLERRSVLFSGERKIPLLLRGIDPALDFAVRPVPVLAGRLLEMGDSSALVLSLAYRPRPGRRGG